MGEYKVTDPKTGRSFKLTGDKPPTEEILNNIFEANSISGVSTKEVAESIRNVKEPVDVYEHLGAGISEEEAQKNPQMGMAKFLQNYGGTPALSFMNQYAGNLPRAFAEKQGVKFPEENLVAKAAGVAGGVMGIPQKLAMGVGRGISKIAPRLGAVGSRMGGLGSIAKGAIQGGVAGGSYTPQGSDDLLALKERGKQVATGAFFGGVASRLQYGYFSRKASKLAPAKLKSLEKELIKQGRSKNIRTEKIKMSATSATNTLKKNVDNLQKQLSESIRKAVPQYKEGFKTFFKGFNDTYGSQLDDISTNIGKDIKRQDAYKFITDTITKLTKNPDYAETRAIKDLMRLAKRFKPKQQSSSKFESLFKGTKTPESKPVNFKELNSMIKEVLQGRKFDGKSSIDNLVYDEFRHSYGDFVATFDKSGAFAKLQAEASKVLNVKKFSSKVFKPHSQYDTKKLDSLLTRKAQGKLTSGEKELVIELNKILKEFGSSTDNLAKQLASKQSKLGSVRARASRATSKVKIYNENIVAGLKTKQIDLKNNTSKSGQSLTKKIGGRIIDIAIMSVMYKMMRGIRGE